MCITPCDYTTNETYQKERIDLNEYFAGPIWNTFYCVYHKKASLIFKGSLIFQSFT